MGPRVAMTTDWTNPALPTSSSASPHLSIQNKSTLSPESALVVQSSHHHEDKGDGHEDIGEAHNVLVRCDGHGHGGGRVGHQGHRQREDREGSRGGFQPWAGRHSACTRVRDTRAPSQRDKSLSPIKK